MHPSFALLFLINTNNEILLLKRTNTPFCNQFYCLPGSEIGLNETASTAIINEAQKTIGIDINLSNLKFMHVMHRKCNEPEFFACIFKSESWTGIPMIKTPENYDDLKWFSLDKLPINIVPAHLHAIEQIQQNRTYSEHGWNKYDNKALNVNKSDCLFCKRASQKDLTVVSRLKHCFVIKDNFPVSPGHVLIIPNNHFDNWFEATQEVQFDIFKAISETKKILDQEYHPDGYNIGINCGQAAGQTVMHLHVHLIPRYKGDMEDPRGGVRGVIPSKQKYTK